MVYFLLVGSEAGLSPGCTHGSSVVSGSGSTHPNLGMYVGPACKSGPAISGTSIVSLRVEMCAGSGVTLVTSFNKQQLQPSGAGSSF